MREDCGGEEEDYGRQGFLLRWWVASGTPGIRTVWVRGGVPCGQHGLRLGAPAWVRLRHACVGPGASPALASACGLRLGAPAWVGFGVRALARVRRPLWLRHVACASVQRPGSGSACVRWPGCVARFGFGMWLAPRCSGLGWLRRVCVGLGAPACVGFGMWLAARCTGLGWLRRVCVGLGAPACVGFGMWLAARCTGLGWLRRACVGPGASPALASACGLRLGAPAWVGFGVCVSAWVLRPALASACGVHLRAPALRWLRHACVGRVSAGVPGRWLAQPSPAAVAPGGALLPPGWREQASPEHGGASRALPAVLRTRQIQHRPGGGPTRLCLGKP
ncbi:predicted protein [Streptomyces sp. AA4]|nr:predicted protein [Streptomyces sp. AA4]